MIRDNPWALTGLLLWTMSSVLVGAMAVGAPAAVLPHHGTGAWAGLATCMAVGSLAGTLVAATTSISWNVAGPAVGAAIAMQACALAIYIVGGSTASVVALFVAFVIGPTAVTLGGIIWTTTLQTELDHRPLARLSSVDQFLSSAAVPAGMVVVGLLPAGSPTAVMLVAVAIPGAVLGFLARRSKVPRSATALLT
ncbi:hypothetical protein GII30_02350 [Gordonia amarae]|uniref:Uncharacterized protein n=2 Tax=Gordonia amarae TaxID=36821 RepID=A0A857LIJ3_9ACTN|nr:hypothetical protein [Gordonia amarae]MCS3877195.1 hypothetical protein [Gordonia amarae]QHN15978.1 hypothetical protein GII35_02355 [Gordonia amarae]QHN20546.1 hypothetical protein GII34_02355 [Gordonia amarae]QHN29399.1 hypothetical protein GII32_02360 [Gordonia amarae]QHN38175.1 hypothetical protein GII30_02350 [Gordonia amarae]